MEKGATEQKAQNCSASPIKLLSTKIFQKNKFGQKF